MISISIVICTYNNASLLGRTLATIEQQEIPEGLRWSALVVDNNSTDGTSGTVQRYVQRELIPGLRYVLEEQLGLAYARRRAVQETDTELIAFVDDDCLLAPNWVEQAVIFCHGHPNLGAVGGRVQLLWEVTPDETMLSQAPWFAEQDYGDLPQCLPTADLRGAGVVLQREAVVASGWLERMIMTDRRGNVLSSHGDTEMMIRIRNAGYELWYNPAMCLEHYIPQRRMSIGYLCRLRRGVSQGEGLIAAIANNRKPSFRQRLETFSRTALTFMRFSMSIIIRDFLLKQHIPSLERRLLFHNLLGQLEGAWTALPGRFNI